MKIVVKNYSVGKHTFCVIKPEFKDIFPYDAYKLVKRYFTGSRIMHSPEAFVIRITRRYLYIMVQGSSIIYKVNHWVFCDWILNTDYENYRREIWQTQSMQMWPSFKHLAEVFCLDYASLLCRIRDGYAAC